jgi:drug/metabolite transporter (DMT)-like permease
VSTSTIPRHTAHPAGTAVLAAMCGGSMLVLLGVGGGFGLVVLVAVKAAAAAAFLAPWLHDASRRRVLLRHAGALVGLSLLSSTLPFLLAALAAPGVGAGALAVAHATLPVAVVLAGAAWLGARAGGLPFTGFVVGLGGLVLLQWQGMALQLAPEVGGAHAGAAAVALPAPTTLALAAASIAALCGVLGMPPARPRLSVADAVALAVAAEGGSALILLVPAAWLWLHTESGTGAWGQVVGLAAIGAGLGLALRDRLVRCGAQRALACGQAMQRCAGPLGPPDFPAGPRNGLARHRKGVQGVNPEADRHGGRLVPGEPLGLWPWPHPGSAPGLDRSCSGG